MDGIEEYIVYEGTNGNGSFGYTQVFIPEDYSTQIGDLYITRGDYTNYIKVIHSNNKVCDISFHCTDSDYVDYIDRDNLTQNDVVLRSFDENRAKDICNSFQAIGYAVPRTTMLVTVPNLGEYLSPQNQVSKEVSDAICDEVALQNSYTGVLPDDVLKIYYETYKPGM